MFLAEHFTVPPNWYWWILAYFFFAGLSGGAYALGTMLRLWGRPQDESAARLCFLLALPLLILCPIFLIIDLGQPLRFWHMMFDTGVEGPALIFKYWSPMSLGVWALLAFGVFATLSFLEAVALDGRYRFPLRGLVASVMGSVVGRAISVIGTVLGLFVAGYTGVLLSVSNQPVWSDTWALGGLFLASGMSGAAALVVLFTRWRPSAAVSEDTIAEADGYFALLELVFLVFFFVSVAFAGQFLRAVAAPWFLLWIVAVASLAPPLLGRFGGGLQISPSGTAALARVGISSALAAVIILVGVAAMRAAVIWSAQA